MSAYGFDRFGSEPSQPSNNDGDGDATLQRIMAQFFSQVEQMFVIASSLTSIDFHPH